jgi:outer membrane immunogenic protein
LTAKLGFRFRAKVHSTNFAAGFAPALDAVSGTTLRPQGWIAGVQAGYNWQVNQFVFGIEADASWLNGTSSRAAVFGALGPSAAGTFMNDSSKESFLATVRPRLGFAVGQALFYATGGVAFGTVRTTDQLGFPGNFLDTTNASTTRTGWTAGAGAEYAFTNNWSVKAEYLYVDLGTTRVGLVCTVAPCVAVNDSVVSHRYTDNIGRIGLNYRFGGPVVARY